MIRLLYHIAKADFLERTRRYSFIVTTGILIYLTYLSLPPIDAKYLLVGMGDFRGIYNSAWIGGSIALLCNTMLSLVGFYLINNSIKRDNVTGVGQIIATTPLSKLAYLIGKMLSNLIFLMSMVGVISIVSIGMQIYRAESVTIDLWAFFSPIIFTTIPLMALVSAVALFFESVKFLRSGIGNVLYYALLMVVMMASLGFDDEQMDKESALDPFGMIVIIGSMQKTVHENIPDYGGGFAIGGSDVKDHVITFEWEGVDWKAEIILWRLVWFSMAFAIVLFVSLFFKRFDPSYQFRKRKRQVSKPEILIPEEELPDENVHLSPLTRNETGIISRLIFTVKAELKIMLKGLHKIWYAGALLLIILTLTLPFDAARQFILPISWVWPLLIWSKMGNRELQFRTNQFMFSSPYPVIGQLPAVWLAGFVVALITGVGWPVRMLFVGEFGLIVAWLAGAAFIPSLALAMGVWTGSSKMFEIVYFILWYVGPMNQTPFLDFIGYTGNLLTPEVTITFFVITISLILLSIIGRRKQVYV
ncbi:hypothetical protein ACFLTH_00995 [Bacteroidota bacterium]